jgi:hypothetical protein
MTLSRRVILHSPISDASLLREFVERCLGDGVSLLAIMGPDANALEDEVDWIVIGDGSGPDDRFLCTSAHCDETLDDVIVMMRHWQIDNDDDGHIEQVSI